MAEISGEQRKTAFISFLGTSDYLECNYVYDGKTCRKVQFIQTALRELLLPDADQTLLFVTEKARKNNLGKLREEEAARKLTAITEVSIPEGQDESELWEIFRIVGEQIPENRDIIFDITHSLRSLPVLMSILVNYLRCTKGARLVGCYYGAFEKLGTRKEVENIPLEERDAPIFNLTPFFILNDWTDAISQYLQYGRAKALTKLALPNLLSILKDSRGTDREASALRKVVERINEFSALVHISNCKQLYQMNIQSEIAAPLASLDTSRLPQLRPVLRQVQRMFADYEDASIRNGLRIARWCARHDLIPQGFTILQETVVSLEAEKIRNRLAEVCHEEIEGRELVSNVLGKLAQSPSLPPNMFDTEEKNQLAADIAPTCSREFLKTYNSLTQGRNQVNHGCLGHNRVDPEKVRSTLKECVEYMLNHYSV